MIKCPDSVLSSEVTRFRAGDSHFKDLKSESPALHRYAHGFNLKSPPATMGVYISKVTNTGGYGNVMFQIGSNPVTTSGWKKENRHGIPWVVPSDGSQFFDSDPAVHRVIVHAISTTCQAD